MCTIAIFLMPERFYILISKKLNDTLSSVELDELEAMCMADPKYQREYEAIEAMWYKKLPQAQVDPEVFERHLQRMRSAGHSFGPSFQKNLSDKKVSEGPNIRLFSTGRTLYRWISAAVFMGIVFSAYWIFIMPADNGEPKAANQNEVINEVQTRPGSNSKMVLPDGSQVWVNASSRLTYDQQFGRTHRNIQLDGEAYFIVSKNKEMPFIIQTQNVNIKVTGTIFNVRAYENENRTETALVEGSVQVEVKSEPGKIYRLKPSQKLVVRHSYEETPDERNIKERAPMGKSHEQVLLGEVNYTATDSLLVETAWLYSTLAFSNESFAEVAQKMEKWYGVEIVFESSVLEKIRFSGTFTKESVNEALEALQYTATFKFRRNGDRIIIYN